MAVYRDVLPHAGRWLNEASQRLVEAILPNACPESLKFDLLSSVIMDFFLKKIAWWTAR